LFRQAIQESNSISLVKRNFTALFGDTTMKPTNTFVKLFSSVSTLAVVASAMAFNGVALGQVGQVLAWGENDTGNQCRIPTAATNGVTAIAGGGYHTIALKDGAVLAWGAGETYTGTYPEYGQSIVPTAAQSGVTAIAGGELFTIALKDGGVRAWGRNNFGQCTVPTAAQSGVSAIACGYLHTIALKNGGVLAWGLDSGNSTAYGQCTVPAAAQSGVSAIAGGGYHTIALKDGGVLVWGQMNQSSVPAAANSGVTAIAGGGYATIALKDGGVLAWGTLDYGQFAVPAAAQSGVSAIAGGVYHTLALKDGAVLAWGINWFGQSTIPASAQSGVIAIASGVYHTIALKSHETITGVLPISGSSSGGTNITITGTQFDAAATVTIGGAPATNVVVVSDTQITATTPAGFPGPAVVTVGLGSSAAFYYRPSCGSDLDNNGVVDSADLGIVLLDFGNCYESAAAAPQEPMIFPIEAAKPVAVKK